MMVALLTAFHAWKFVQYDLFSLAKLHTQRWSRIPHRNYAEERKRERERGRKKAIRSERHKIETYRLMFFIFLYISSKLVVNLNSLMIFIIKFFKPHQFLIWLSGDVSTLITRNPYQSLNNRCLIWLSKFDNGCMPIQLQNKIINTTNFDKINV